MSLRAILKNENRTLLELRTGIIFLGLIGLVITACLAFVPSMDARWMCISWIFGILTALVSATDMYRTLDKALDLPEGNARKKIYFGYIRRYVIFGVMLAIFCLSDKLDPVVFFIAYITLKLSAYLQPLTHKAFNAYFHETDPVSLSQEEYDALHPEVAAHFAKASDKKDGSEDKSSETSASADDH